MFLILKVNQIFNNKQDQQQEISRWISVVAVRGKPTSVQPLCDFPLSFYLEL